MKTSGSYVRLPDITRPDGHFKARATIDPNQLSQGTHCHLLVGLKQSNTRFTVRKVVGMAIIQ